MTALRHQLDVLDDQSGAAGNAVGEKQGWGFGDWIGVVGDSPIAPGRQALESGLDQLSSLVMSGSNKRLEQSLASPSPKAGAVAQPALVLSNSGKRMD